MYRRFIKRFIDIILSFAALAVLAVPKLIIAIIITTVLAIVFIGIDMWLRVKSAREAGAKSHE